MATQQQPTSGQATQIATVPPAQTDAPTPEEKESATALAVGNLPDEVKNALILQRQRNIVTAKLAETNWGKGLDRETRRAISDWGQRAGIDPVTELNVLGGNFYKNAYYYLRRQAELMAEGIIEYAYAEHVEINDELTAMASNNANPQAKDWAIAELGRRAQQRILFNIPAKAKSSVVWHVKVRGVPIEFVAAKWCGGGSRQKDPVGDEFPVETSETRAARRAMRLLSDWRPSDPKLRKLVEVNDDDTIDSEIGDTLRRGLARAKEDAQRSIEQARGHTIKTLPAGDPYGLETATRTQQAEPVAAAATEESVPQMQAEPVREREPGEEPEQPEEINDLDLLTPDERREHDERKRSGRT